MTAPRRLVGLTHPGAMALSTRISTRQYSLSAGLQEVESYRGDRAGIWIKTEGYFGGSG